MPITEPESSPRGLRASRRVVFASAHSLLDFSNVASVATLDILNGLGAAGFECQAFCTPKLDFEAEVRFEDVVEATREPHQIRQSLCGPERARVLYTRRGRVPITVIRLDSTRHVYDRLDEVRTVGGFFGKFLDVNKPDVVLTYGGDPITAEMIEQAGRRGIPVVFALHNFAYTDARFFERVDYCLVASDFARRHYHDKVGLECRALPYPVDWDRARAERGQPRFATFVNPCLEKGVYPFARIAHELGRRRPDIPLLVVESRGNRERLAACGLDLMSAGNLRIMAHTTDPREFWGVTKLTLLPSLWWENQPLVAVESMINGVPVVGSDRGGIPETLGRAGVVLRLPDRLTPTSDILPAADEVEPWVRAVIRLWDEPELYREHRDKARREAERWRPERLRPMYADFFRSVRVQPGAPMLARRARAAGSARAAEREPLSFVVCVSDDLVARANLLASPDLTRPGGVHETILIHGAPSAAAGLTMGILRARHRWVVCVTQEVLLPEGWDLRLARGLAESERRFGPIGVAGVYGVGPAIESAGRAPTAQRIGRVADQGRTLVDGPELPARAATLDDLLLVLPRDGPLRFDPALGFHLHGADVCLQAAERGLAVVVIDAGLHHICTALEPSEALYQSARIMARKWRRRLPLATTSVVIDRDGDVHVLEDAGNREDSIAQALSEP